jgi:hypothetical protein
LKHPLTTVIALWFAAWVHYQRGDRAATKAVVERALTLVTEYAISGWTDTAVLLPWASGAHLSRRELAELRGQIPRAASAVWRRVFSHCALVQLYIAAGHFDEGLAVLGEEISAADRAAFYGPEVHRLEGELRAKIAPSDPDSAQACLRKALDLADARGEKSLALRRDKPRAVLAQSGKAWRGAHGAGVGLRLVQRGLRSPGPRAREGFAGPTRGKLLNCDSGIPCELCTVSRRWQKSWQRCVAPFRDPVRQRQGTAGRYRAISAALIKSSRHSSEDVRKLVLSKGVGVIADSASGPAGEGHLRINLIGKLDDIREGLLGLVRAMKA